MTTKPDSPADGNQEEATSDVSESVGNQMGSSGEAKYLTEEKFTQLFNSGLETFRRSLQSEKDKGIKKTNERIDMMEGDVKQILQLAKKSGKSVDEILSDIDAQEEAEARQATLEIAKMFREGKLPGVGSQGSEKTNGVDVNAVLNELELDESDTRVQAFRARQFTSSEELYRESAKLVKQIHTRQPSDSDTPSHEGKRKEPVASREQLQQEYQTRSKGLYGTDLVRLKREMREKGLTV